MRRGKGCRPQGLDTSKHLVALRAMGCDAAGCAAASKNTRRLFDSGVLRGKHECLA